MGSNHLRVIRENPSFDLKAVVDVKIPEDFERTNAGIAAFRSVEELDAADISYEAIVIAAPTGMHFDLARQFIARGKHILVEKPLASTLEECRVLIDDAKARALTLAVGHVERFNPAVRKLNEVIRNGWLDKPIHFSVTRVGGYPETLVPGDNVMLDLAVHDVDVIQSLIGPLTVVSSIVHNTVRSDVPDTAEILLKNGDGVSASIHVNWITPTKIRTIRVTGTRGVCFVDYILQTCTLMGGNLLGQMPVLETDFQNLLKQYQNSDKIEFGIQHEEPLKVQLRAFHKALLGDPSEICTGEDGAAAVEVSLRALSSLA
jgi:UDP-N-acetylglucosamine 3-dehydrogenase